MSSKVFMPDDGWSANPVSWPQVETVSDDPKSAAEFDRELSAQVEQLRQQYEQRVQEARAAGMREGEAAGRARATAEFQPALERLARSIEDIANLRARLRKEAEADMVKLSLAIARRVLRRELAVDPEALHGLVLAALEKLQGQEVCRARVHPSHAQAVTAFLQKSATASSIEVIADGSRSPGSVIFETARGNLDASVDSQLDEIERGLADCLKRHS